MKKVILAGMLAFMCFSCGDDGDSICGAPTKDGGICKRHVKSGGRCWQHR